MWRALKSLLRRSIFGGKNPVLSGQRRPRGTRYARLDLDTLEDRIVPTIFFTDQLSHTSVENGGAGLNDVQVHLIIWDGAASQFNASSSAQRLTPTQIFQTITAVQQLLASPWLSELPGSSDGVASYAGFSLDTNPLPSKLTLGAVSGQVADLNLPTGPEMLYVVLTPSNWPSDHPHDNGYNWVPLTGTGAPAYSMAWDIDQENVGPGASDNSSPTSSGWSVDNVTLTLSHEIAECMSSPNDFGFMQYNDPTKNNPSGSLLSQICDGEQSNYFYRESDGVLVEPYFFGSNSYFEAPDGSPDANFLLSALNPGSGNNSGEQTTGYDLTIGDWGPFGSSIQNGQFTISTTTLTLPWGGTQQELTITANGQTAQFDVGTIHSITVYPDPGMSNTLTLNGIPAGITLDTYNGANGGQLTTLKVVADATPAPAGGHTVVLTNASVTVDGVSLPFLFGGNGGPLLDPYKIELDGTDCAFTIKSMSASSVTVNSYGGNNKIQVDGTANFSLLTINASQGDLITVGLNGTIDGIADNSLVVNGGSLTVNASAETMNTLPFSVTSDLVSFGPEGQIPVFSVETSSIDQLTVDSGPAAPDVYIESASCPITVNPSPNSNCLVSLFGAPVTSTSPLGLTVDDSSDAASNPITVTNKYIYYGPANNPSVTINTQQTKQVTFNAGPNTNIISVASTSVPTIVNPFGTGTVSLAPTAQNLNQIGQLTINGSGSTPLIINDTNAAGASNKTMYYGLSQGGLTRGLVSTASLPPPPTSSALTTKLKFSALGSLTLNLTNNASRLDVAGTPAATTIQVGAAAATVNLAPVAQNLNGIVGLLDVQGGGSTTLNAYDQAQTNTSGTDLYQFTDGAITRTVPSTSSQTVTTVNYYDLSAINWWSGHSTNDIDIEGTAGTPLTVHAGTPSDQITVTPPTVTGVTGSGLTQTVNLSQKLGALTIAGDGASLTVDGSAARNHWQANNTSTAAVAENNSANFTVTNQTVTYNLNYTQKTDAVVTKFRSATLASAIVSKQFSFPINYTNLQDLTVDGGPVNTTFEVESTPSGTPVNANGGSGTAYSARLVAKTISESQTATSNTFTVGNNGSVKKILSKVTFDPAGGAVTVDDTLATSKDQVTISNGVSGDVQVGNGAHDKLFGAGGWLDCIGISQLTLNLSHAAGDTVQVTPSAVTEFYLNGSAAEYPGAGAAAVTVTGVPPVPAPSITSPGAGSYAFANSLQNVNFSNMQTSAPVITMMSQRKGPAAGNFSITITGTHFTGATGVDFGGVPAVSFTVKSATQIVAVVPAEVASVESDYDLDEEKLGETDNPNATPPMTIDPIVDVTITTPTGGPSAPVSTDQFTYITPKTALAITWLPPIPLTYGAALSSVQLDASANVPGSFSYTPAVGAVLGAGLQELQAVFTPTNSTVYPVVTATTQLAVGQAAPTVTMNAVNLTSGTPLDDSQLSGTATATVNGQVVDVPGSFFFTSPSADGTILGAGQNQSEAVTFIPTDATDFSNVQTTVTINVTSGQLTPVVSVNLVLISYGTVLDNSQLSGTASYNANPITGTFTYTSAAGLLLGAASGQTEQVTFTPDDSIDYSSVQTTVTVDVVTASPSLFVNPVNITYGTPLADTQLTGTATAAIAGQITNIPGSFSFGAGDGTILSPGQDQLVSIVFTPQDSIDFNAIDTSVSVNVSSGQTVPQLSLSAVTLVYGEALDDSQLSGTATAIVNGQSVNVSGGFAYTSADGAILDAGQGQSELVTFTPDDNVDYSTAQATVTVNVFQATPQVSVNAVSFPFGTAFDNSQLSGTATAVVNGQSVNVSGSFSYTDSSFIGSVLGPPGQYPIEVTFTPDDTIDYETVETNVTVTVSQMTPQVSVNAVNISTGTALANSQLSGTATAVSGGVTFSIAGTFTYTNAAGIVLGAGQGQTEQVTFTPANSADFSVVQTSVTINVTTSQVAPQVTVNSVNIPYGTAFANSQLGGSASALVNGVSTSVPGTFTYTSVAGEAFGAGQQNVSVTFTPNNTTAFDTVQVNVPVIIAPATPQVSVNQVTVTYGAALTNSQLTGKGTATAVVGGVTVNVPGTFTWTSAVGAIFNAGTHTVAVTFTPDDTTDFATVATSAQLNVRAAQPSISTPTSSINPSDDGISVTFTVIVQAPAYGTPQGTVTFFDGTTSLGTVNVQTVNGQQQASLLTNALNPGTNSITAVYTDTVDSNFAEVTSAVLQQIVNEQNN